MRLRVVGLAVVVVSLLAGCVDDTVDPVDTAADPDAGTDEDPGLVLEAADPVEAVPAWNVTASDCNILVASVPLLAGPTREQMPDGFVPLPYQGIPETAGAALVVTRCATSSSPAGGLQDHQEAFVYVYVDPPQEYRVHGIDIYRVMIRHGVAHDELVAGYAGANMTVAEATTTAVVDRPHEWLRVASAQAVFDDLTFSFRGPMLDAEGSGPGKLRVFTMASRAVTGALDLEIHDSTNFLGGSAYLVETGSLFGRPAGPALLVQYDVASGSGYHIAPVLGNLTA